MKGEARAITLLTSTSPMPATVEKIAPETVVMMMPWVKGDWQRSAVAENRVFAFGEYRLTARVLFRICSAHVRGKRVAE
jgi:hypothetical protein